MDTDQIAQMRPSSQASAPSDRNHVLVSHDPLFVYLHVGWLLAKVPPSTGFIGFSGCLPLPLDPAAAASGPRQSFLRTRLQGRRSACVKSSPEVCELVL